MSAMELESEALTGDVQIIALLNILLDANQHEAHELDDDDVLISRFLQVFSY